MENLAKRPSKGILKSSSSIERQDSKLTRQNSHDKDIKWDEMNILQTLHPPDKDYGHMKIEEPKTPYSYYNDNDEEVTSDNEAPREIDPSNLADLINKKTKEDAFSFAEEKSDMSTGEEDTEDLSDLTEEERERRGDFESKRKKHYNEFQMVKLARKLMNDENEEATEDDDEAGASGASSSHATTATAASSSSTTGEQ